MNFNFKFGKDKTDKKKLMIVGIIISTIIAILSQTTGISENKLWDLLDEIQRKYFLQGPINELIIGDPEKIERRVERDVDAAIEKYVSERLEDPIIPKPRLVEKPPDGSEAQKLLGGEMRLCAPWVDDCPKE